MELSFRKHEAVAELADGDGNEEIQLLWAAIERLPTFRRIQTSLIDDDDELKKRVVDVSKIGCEERRVFIDKLIKHIENDNLQLLQKLRERIDRFGFDSV